MTTPAFSPGKFTPVINIAQVPTPGPIAVDTDLTGLEQISEVTTRVAFSNTLGHGGYQSLTNGILANQALTTALLLQARNLAEQLKEVGVYTKFTSVLTNTRTVLLEPVVRAYNYYGGFHVQDKHYVTRSLEDRLASTLIRLCAQTAPGQLDNENKVSCLATSLDEIDMKFYHINENGELEFSNKADLNRKIKEITSAILSSTDISQDEVKFSLIRSAMDISTHTDFRRFRDVARSKGLSFVPTDMVLTITDDHKKHAKNIFGQTSFTNGTTILTGRIVSKITTAFDISRHWTSMLSLKMRTMPLPQYEGGTPAQLATLEDSVLYSEQPISFADATVATALSTSYGCAMRFRSAPSEERETLIRTLVMQSVT